MKRIFKISFLALSKKNKSFRITFFILLLVSFLILSSVSIIQIHQIKMAYSRGNVYGYFHSILYQNEEDKNKYNIDDDIANIEAFNTELPGGTRLTVGTKNKMANKMLYRGIPDLESNDIEYGECLISQHIAEKLNLKQDEKININGNNFNIKSIVPDIGFLWVRGEREEKQKMEVPNIWLNSHDFEKLAGFEENNIYRLILLDSRQTSEINSTLYSGNLYENTPILGDENVFAYRFSQDFFLIQLLALFILVFILIFSYKRNSNRRYNILKDLGITDSHLSKIKKIEIILLSIPPLLISIILSYITCIVYNHIAYADSTFFSIMIYFKVINYYIVSYLLALAICGFEFKSLKNINIGNLKNMRHKRPSIPIKGNRILVASSFLMFLLSYIVISFYSSTSAINKMNSEIELYGQLNKKFDFDIHFEEDKLDYNYYKYGNEKIAINDADAPRWTFFYDDFQHKLDEISLKLKNIKGIKRIECFYENKYGQMEVSNKIINSPLIEKIYVASTLPLEPGPFKKLFIGDGLDTLISCDFYMLPDDYLKDIAGTIKIDKTNTSKLLNGEGAILISPSIKINKIKKDANGESVYWERSTSGDNLIKDDDLLKYKTINVYFPQANKNLYGIIPQEEIISHKGRLEKINIKILGSSYRNLGWFTNSSTESPYRILVSKSFLNKSHINHETTRIRIFLDPQADYKTISYNISSMIRGIPRIQLIDQHYNLSAYHEYLFMEKIILISCFFLVSTLVFSFAFSIVNVFWLENEKNFCLFRDLGIKNKKLFFACFKQYSKILIFSFLIQIIFNRFVMWEIITGWSEMSFLERVISQAMVYVIYSIIFFIFFSKKIRSLMRKKEYTV